MSTHWTDDGCPGGHRAVDPVDVKRVLSPLDRLAGRYGPEGAGAMKPCPVAGTGPGGLCTSCNGRGQVLDVEHPLFAALWEPCREGPGRCVSDCSGCSGLSYIRRSSAEVALLLPKAAKAMHSEYGRGVIITLHHDHYPDRDVFVCNLERRSGGEYGWIASGEADNWLDALADALLAAEDKS